MASTETKIHKQGAAATIWDTTLTIPVTLEIIRKPGNATSHSIIMAAHNTGFLTNYGIKEKEKKKKNTCNNLGQQRYCLRNTIFNNAAPLPSCACQIK